MSATTGSHPARRGLGRTPMKSKNPNRENDTDCEQHSLSNDRAAEMLDSILDRERHALSVIDEALLRAVCDSLRDPALSTQMLDAQLDSILQNNDRLSRDSQQIISGVQEIVDDRDVLISDGGVIPTDTRSQDVCRDCGAELGAGYLCDDCDELEVER